MPRSLFALAPYSILVVALCGLGAPAFAETVDVTVTGTVDQNQVTTGELGGVSPGDRVVLSFQVDSAVFADSTNFPTRGYPIDPASFSMVLGSANLALQSPFPGGQTPYFTLRDNDPAVDGFFVATSLDFPIGVPLDEVGIFGNFVDNFSVTYDGSTLSSLDILGAQGSYAFAGLSVFNFTIDDGGFSPVLIHFDGVTISAQAAAIPTLPEWGLLALVALLLVHGALLLRGRASAAAPAA